MQLKDQLKLVKFKLDNINQIHDKLSRQEGLSTIEFDLLLRNMMEVYEFYHIMKMEKVLWQQTDPNIYNQDQPEDQQMPEVNAGSVIENNASFQDEDEITELMEEEKREVFIPEEDESEIVITRNTTESSRLSLFDVEADLEIVSRPSDNPVSEFLADSIESETSPGQNEMQAMVEDTLTDTENNEKLEWQLEEKTILAVEMRNDIIEEQFSENEDNSPDRSFLYADPEQMEVPVMGKRETYPSSASITSPIETKIAINDKFLFIRELFGGDFDAYEQTLFEINKLETRNEALDYLSNHVTDRFDWLDKEEVANDFFILIQQHFNF